jgi:hypothetical protein
VRQWEGAQNLFNPNEAKTRKDLIDPALQKAGWDVNNPDQVGLEIPVDGSDPKAWAAITEAEPACPGRTLQYASQVARTVLAK